MGVHSPTHKLVARFQGGFQHSRNVKIPNFRTPEMTQPVFITSINFLTIFEISNSFWKSIITYKWDTHTPTNILVFGYRYKTFMCTIKMLTRLSVVTKADLSFQYCPGWPEYLDGQRLTPVTYSLGRHQVHIASGWQRLLETKDLSLNTLFKLTNISIFSWCII